MIKATALATTVAKQHGVKRHQAFDMILAVAADLEIPATTTAYDERVADEIAHVIAYDISKGKTPTLNRTAI